MTSLCPRKSETPLRKIDRCEIRSICRLHAQQTESFRAKIMGNPARNHPVDSLDMILRAGYNQSEDVFANKNEVYAQQRRTDCGSELGFAPSESREKSQMTILVGGIPERISPHSIQLINIGQHTPKTNPGYSRQNNDGTFFNY